MALYFLKGIFKGAVSMVLSLLSVFVVSALAWDLVDVVLPFVSSIVEEPLMKLFSNLLNEFVPGQFSNLAEFESSLNVLNISMFSIIEQLLGNLSFDGNLTAGQILAPSMSSFATKVITFLLLFFIISLVVKMIKLFVNKLIKLCGFSFSNRLIGGTLGIVKGLAIFLLMYFVLNVLSNLLLIESLNKFIQSGNVSKVIYDFIVGVLI